MSKLYWLSEGEFARIEPLLPRGRRGAHRVDDRRVVSGIVHMLHSGARWRDCPAEYGPYTTIYNRFNRWSRQGIWLEIFEALTGTRAVIGMASIDSSHIKAHRSAAGGNVWPATSASDFLRGRHDSLHKRIRPFGYAVGQDGDPRALLLIRGTASGCHFTP